MLRPSQSSSATLALARLSLRGQPAVPSSRMARAMTALNAQPIARFQTSARHTGPLRPTSMVLAANPQSGKPASDNWQHMAQNVKEEASQVRSSLESAVAGSGEKRAPRDSSGDSTGASALLSDAKTITGEMAQEVPRPALQWGAAGVLPYLGTAGASIYLARQANRVSQGLDASIDLETASALLLHAQNVQVAYGAIILSFLGAIHWGFEWGKVGGRQGHVRYAMGVAPLLVAWPTLLLGPQMALISQWAAYVGVWFIDLKATNQGWTPRWYSTYRFWLTAAVGSSIILTLAGTNYYDVSPSRSSQRGAGSKLAASVKADAKQAIEEARANAQGIKGTTPVKGKVGGDVLAQQNDDSGDSFIKVGNPKRREEEERKKKKEEAEKKKKEEQEQAKKKKEQDAAAQKEGEGEGEGEGKKEDKEGEGEAEQKEGEGEKDDGGEGEKKESGDDDEKK
ncbi:unnamed protein product [Parajaminaea phylloscopi]